MAIGIFPSRVCDRLALRELTSEKWHRDGGRSTEAHDSEERVDEEHLAGWPARKLECLKRRVLLM